MHFLKEASQLIQNRSKRTLHLPNGGKLQKWMQQATPPGRYQVWKQRERGAGRPCRERVQRPAARLAAPSRFPGPSFPTALPPAPRAPSCRRRGARASTAAVVAVCGQEHVDGAIPIRDLRGAGSAWDTAGDRSASRSRSKLSSPLASTRLTSVWFFSQPPFCPDLMGSQQDRRGAGPPSEPAPRSSPNSAPRPSQSENSLPLSVSTGPPSARANPPRRVAARRRRERPRHGRVGAARRQRAQPELAGAAIERQHPLAVGGPAQQRVH